MFFTFCCTLTLPSNPFNYADHSSNFFTIKLLHGGGIILLMVGTRFKGGKLDYMDYCDEDRMSLPELDEMMAKEVEYLDYVSFP